MARQRNGNGDGDRERGRHEPRGSTYGGPPARRENREPGRDRPGTRRRGGWEAYDVPRWIDDEDTWWWVPGPYSGVGPAGYNRTDERICDEVCDRLCRHGLIDARHIDVEVNDGEVELRGTVDSRRTKRMAEHVAESVFGVRDVHNELKIEVLGSEYRQPGSAAGIRPGMDVRSSDGRHIGQVRAVRGSDFWLSRPPARDLFVPLGVGRVSGSELALSVPADQVDNQGWPPIEDQEPQFPGSG